MPSRPLCHSGERSDEESALVEQTDPPFARDDSPIAMRVDLFDYDLPADLIAQEAHPRGTSRLLVLDRKTGSISHRVFSDLPEQLATGDLLVRNDVAVRPARLWGRDGQGRLVEIFLLERL